MRTVEKNGREYVFLSVDEFKQWIDRDRFVEYAEVYGNFYGTPRKSLEDGLSAGYYILMDVDVQGARKLMDLYPDGIFFYIIPPDIAELERRLKRRDTDKDEVIKNRLAKAMQELEYKRDYRYVIENRNLQETVSRILQIIKKELGNQRSNK
jgi:guanylate kinase